jgi:hypothetical protein
MMVGALDVVRPGLGLPLVHGGGGRGLGFVVEHQGHQLGAGGAVDCGVMEDGQGRETGCPPAPSMT